MEILPVERNRDIERLLGSANVKLIGDLTILGTSNGREYSVRRVIYLEPQNPPQIPVLSDRQVDALNAAMYFHRQPTPELTTIPLQFVDEYNAILESLSEKAGGQVGLNPFVLRVSNIGESHIGLGSLSFRTTLGKSQVVTTTTTEFSLDCPSLEQQIKRFSEPTVQKFANNIDGLLWFRLFPPGLGSRIYAYEKGYYVYGNVEEWEELTYRNRYINYWTLSFDQLQALARGEEPYPEVKYLEKSIFDGKSPQEIIKILQEREQKRVSWILTIGEWFRPYSGGNFSEDSYDPNIQRDADPNAKHTHHGTGLIVWDAPVDQI